MPLGNRRASISKSSIGGNMKNNTTVRASSRAHSRSKSSELVKVAIDNSQVQEVGEIPQYQYKEVPSLDI